MTRVQRLETLLTGALKRVQELEARLPKANFTLDELPSSDLPQLEEGNEEDFRWLSVGHEDAVMVDSGECGDLEQYKWHWYAPLKVDEAD